VMKQAGAGIRGRRLRGLIVVLWRAGLRISEALALAESDLEEGRGSLLGGTGRAGVAERSGWTIGRGISFGHGSSVACCFPLGHSSA
jgi:hypothetical protein